MDTIAHNPTDEYSIFTTVFKFIVFTSAAGEAA